MGNNQRLTEERKRLGHTQESFGEIGGVKLQAQNMYEAGKRQPDMAYLTAIAQAGADVQYILTGQRTSADFTQLEIELIHAYRNTTSAGRAAVLAVLSAATPNLQSADQTRQVFHAPVGLVIENNIGRARSSADKK